MRLALECGNLADGIICKEQKFRILLEKDGLKVVCDNIRPHKQSVEDALAGLVPAKRSHHKKEPTVKP